MAREEEIELPDDFDALLRNEMAAVPSTAFLPRVRRRIAEESATSPRWFWRLLVPAGALAVAVVVVVSVANLREPVVLPSAPPPPLVQAADPIVLPAFSPEVPPVPSAIVRLAAAKPVERTSEDPVVIVDERQRAAVRALIRLVHEGRLTDEAFAQTVPTSLQPIRETVLPVGVAPVAVSPIVDSGVLQLETQK